MDTRQVNITYHRKDGVWWAESDDMPGFSAAGDTFAETRKLAREDIPFFFDDNEPTTIREFLDNGTEVVPNNTIFVFPTPELMKNGGKGEYFEPVNVSTTANQGIEERRMVA